MKLDNTKALTFGELYHPLVNIKTEKEASAYFEELVQYAIIRFGKGREENYSRKIEIQVQILVGALEKIWESQKNQRYLK